jgi:hypothetical protein
MGFPRENSICSIFAGIGVTLFISCVAVAGTGTLRIAEYNLDSADQGNDNNITASYAGIPSVIEAIGEHHIGTNAQPVDVLALTELLPPTGSGPSQTLIDLTNALNSFYGKGVYAYDTTADPTTTSTDGPSGLIYDTQTVKLLGVKTLADSSSGAPRAPMRFELQAAGYGAISNFYLYVSHYKADSAGDDITTDEDRRNVEATEIRTDAASLGSNAHFILSGDTNLAEGSAEPAYQTLTASGSGKAYDPVAYGYVSNWTSSSTTYESIYSHSTTALDERLDLQLVSSAMLNQPGLQLASDDADPYDPRGFPSKQYPYAYEIFGNNGSTPEGKSIDQTTNTSLSDLSNSATILGDLEAPGGSDHLPVVADYDIVTPEPATLSLLILLFPAAMLRRRAPSPSTQTVAPQG